MAEENRTQDKVNQTNNNLAFDQDKQNPRTTTLPFFLRFPNRNSNNNNTLDLGLSLGGIYSSSSNTPPPKTRETPLNRTLSFIPRVNNPSFGGFETQFPKTFLSLAKSSSLPSEVESSETVVVDPKDMRTMKRVEAKKRVEERQMFAWNGCNYNDNFVMEGPPSSPSKIPAWAAASAARSPALNRAIGKIKEGFRRMEGQQGAGTSMAPRYSNYHPSEPIEVKPDIAWETSRGKSVMLIKPDDQNPNKKARHCNGCVQDGGTEVINKMPCVTATGDGPNGRKVDGFLYKYTKGQVIIICLCHGSFLSPEAFVKHAGFMDVTNPMKNINVQPPN